MFRHSLRPALFAAATLAATLIAGTASACPDWRLSGTPLSYSSDQLTRGQSVPIVAGGNVNLATCAQIPGHGYVISQPDFDLSFTDNPQGRDLEIRVTAGCDTVLLVNDASGRWLFDDDGAGQLNPVVRIPQAPAGAYDIWVGTFSSSTCQATLTLTSSGGMVQQQPQPQPQQPQPQLQQPQQMPAMPDPGNLMNYRNQQGQTLRFTVTGATSGSVWGTGIYTDDSVLAAAAVHAGVLTAGQTGAVTVTLMPGQSAYQGSTANGVRSSNYGSWSGSYSFVMPVESGDGTGAAPQAQVPPRSK